MQYQKITSGGTIIEFHNNWLGEETVIVNGQIVSKKSSIWGTSHYFTVMENGHTIRYILTSKVSESMQVALDLSKNGILVQGDIPVRFGSKPRQPKNHAKRAGLLKLQEYDLAGALADLEQAKKFNPDDPEIYFHMACAYSVMEKTRSGFESLQKAVSLGLQDTEIILNHDMLAFLRIHKSFEDFLESGFTAFDSDAVTDPTDGED